MGKDAQQPDRRAAARGGVSFFANLHSPRNLSDGDAEQGRGIGGVELDLGLAGAGVNAACQKQSGGITESNETARHRKPGHPLYHTASGTAPAVRANASRGRLNTA